MTPKEMRERQAKLLADARAKLEEIGDDTPEARAAEINAEHDAMMKEWDALQERIEREQRLSEAEQRKAEREEEEQRANRDARRPRPEDKRIDPDAEQRPTAEEVFKRAVQFGVQALSSEQRSVFASEIASKNLPSELRAQAIGTDAAGGFTVPQGFLAEVTKSMALFGPMLDPGVTRQLVTASGNPLPWPTVNDTANESALTAENVASPTDGSQDVVFGQKQLDAYVYRSGVIQVPLELLQDSAFDMQALLNELLGERIGRAGNKALTTGTGAGQPNGIVTASAQGVVAAANNAITADEIMDLEHSVDPAYRGSPRTRWMFHDTTFKAIRKLKDGQGNFLWQLGDIRAGAPSTLLGHPYSINNAMADVGSGVSSRVIVFGDFNKYIVRRVRDFSLIVMRERFAELLQVGFLAWNRIDGELADTAAVKHMKLAAV
jgi:HK97 family phage major capsid protein